MDNAEAGRPACRGGKEWDAWTVKQTDARGTGTVGGSTDTVTRGTDSAADRTVSVVDGNNGANRGSTIHGDGIAHDIDGQRAFHGGRVVVNGGHAPVIDGNDASNNGSDISNCGNAVDVDNLRAHGSGNGVVANGIAVVINGNGDGNRGIADVSDGIR
jgi:hypothetical protein